jgi:hypothetical protein
MNTTLLGISATVGIGFAIYGTRKWLPKETPAPQEEKQFEVAKLAELSHLWKDREVKIKDAANLWREQSQENNSATPRPSFTHTEIERFFSEMIEHRSSINGIRRDLIIWLLKLLDKEGDCPSVVRKHKDEAERIYSEDSYAMLEAVPLYRHTVTVARNFIAKADQEALLADIILIALAHDIGKIPSYHDGMYSSGDHPIIAGLILNGIPEFVSLPNKEDILRAVTGHHLMKSDNILTDGLKQSDHEARQSELSALYLKMREQKNSRTESGVDTQFAAEEIEPTSARPATTELPSAERADPLGFAPAKEKYTPQLINIPECIDPDAVIESLKNRINLVESTPKGDQWSVVSMPNGVIYVNPDALWEAIKEVSNYDPLVYASEGFEAEKRNLMHSVITELARTKQALATEYVADGYYTSKVSIITGGGKRLSHLLIPLTAQAFGVTASELEEQKSAQLKRMVKDIKHKNKEVEQCVGR